MSNTCDDPNWPEEPNASATRPTWSERHDAWLHAALGSPTDWPQCSGGDWIETMVQRAGWVCGKCGHEPSHPRHNAAEKPRAALAPADTEGGKP